MHKAVASSSSSIGALNRNKLLNVARNEVDKVILLEREKYSHEQSELLSWKTECLQKVIECKVDLDTKFQSICSDSDALDMRLESIDQNYRANLRKYSYRIEVLGKDILKSNLRKEIYQELKSRETLRAFKHRSIISKGQTDFEDSESSNSEIRCESFSCQELGNLLNENEKKTSVHNSLPSYSHLSLQCSICFASLCIMFSCIHENKNSFLNRIRVTLSGLDNRKFTRLSDKNSDDVTMRGNKQSIQPKLLYAQSQYFQVFNFILACLSHGADKKYYLEGITLLEYETLRCIKDEFEDIKGRSSYQPMCHWSKEFTALCELLINSVVLNAGRELLVKNSHLSLTTCIICLASLTGLSFWSSKKCDNEQYPPDFKENVDALSLDVLFCVLRGSGSGSGSSSYASSGDFYELEPERLVYTIQESIMRFCLHSSVMKSTQIQVLHENMHVILRFIDYCQSKMHNSSLEFSIAFTESGNSLNSPKTIFSSRERAYLICFLYFFHDIKCINDSLGQSDLLLPSVVKTIEALDIEIYGHCTFLQQLRVIPQCSSDIIIQKFVPEIVPASLALLVLLNVIDEDFNRAETITRISRRDNQLRSLNHLSFEENWTNFREVHRHSTLCADTNKIDTSKFNTEKTENLISASLLPLKTTVIMKERWLNREYEKMDSQLRRIGAGSWNLPLCNELRAHILEHTQKVCNLCKSRSIGVEQIIEPEIDGFRKTLDKVVRMRNNVDVVINSFLHRKFQDRSWFQRQLLIATQKHTDLISDIGKVKSKIVELKKTISILENLKFEFENGVPDKFIISADLKILLLDPDRDGGVWYIAKLSKERFYLQEKIHSLSHDLDNYIGKNQMLQAVLALKQSKNHPEKSKKLKKKPSLSNQPQLLSQLSPDDSQSMATHNKKHSWRETYMKTKNALLIPKHFIGNSENGMKSYFERLSGRF